MGLEREGGGGPLLNIFGCKYRLMYNKVSRTMSVTAFNGILCLMMISKSGAKILTDWLRWLKSLFFCSLLTFLLAVFVV